MMCARVETTAQSLPLCVYTSQDKVHTVWNVLFSLIFFIYTKVQQFQMDFFGQPNYNMPYTVVKHSTRTLANIKMLNSWYMEALFHIAGRESVLDRISANTQTKCEVCKERSKRRTVTFYSIGTQPFRIDATSKPLVSFWTDRRYVPKAFSKGNWLKKTLIVSQSPFSEIRKYSRFVSITPLSPFSNSDTFCFGSVGNSLRKLLLDKQ